MSLCGHSRMITDTQASLSFTVPENHLFAPLLEWEALAGAAMCGFHFLFLRTQIIWPQDKQARYHPSETSHIQGSSSGESLLVLSLIYY